MTHKRRSKPKTKVEVKKRRRAIEACAPEGGIPTEVEKIEEGFAKLPVLNDEVPTGYKRLPGYEPYAVQESAGHEAPIKIPADILEDGPNRLPTAAHDNPSRMWMVWTALGAVVVGAILWAFGLL